MAGKKTPVWKGSKELTECPDSPEWEFGNQQVKCVRVFHGPHDACMSKRPQIGQLMEGYAQVLVEKVQVKRAPGGKGIMTINLENQKPADGDTQFPEPFQPVYELEWAQLERAIEQNKYFRPVFNAPLNFEAIAKNQAALVKWESEADLDKKLAAFDALKTADTTGRLQELAAAKMAGQATFLLFGPVARITSLSRTIRQSDACGVVYTSAEIPNFPAILPPDYQWLYTADRWTRSGTGGKWQRQQEWTGADHWDTRAYRRKNDATATGGADTPSNGTGGGGGGG